MKQARWTLSLMLIALAGLVPPVFGQGAPEGDEEETAPGGFYVEVGTWIAQPAGIELEPATRVDATNPFGTSPIAMNSGTKTELYYALGYRLPKNYGKFLAWIYDYDEDSLAAAASTPGTFQFGETLVNPLFAGVNLDGLADAFNANGQIKLNDFRLDYSRTAFENSRIRADWFVGWRRVKFNRSMTSNYYALVPGLPPLLPPLSDPKPALDPQPEIGSVSSSFEGRGFSAGMNFEVPLVRDRLRLGAGFSFSALRGDMSANYASTTWYYVLETTGGDILLTPPYNAFNLRVMSTPVESVPLADFIAQRRLRTGIDVEGRSTSASIMDFNLELRYRAWRGLDVVLGFRQTRYDDVAVELRSKVVATPLGTSNLEATFVDAVGNSYTFTSPELVFNVEDVTEENRSVTFEGFYLGVGYQF